MQGNLKKKKKEAIPAFVREVKYQGQSLRGGGGVDGASARKTQTRLFKESDLDLVTFDWSFLSQTQTTVS